MVGPISASTEFDCAAIACSAESSICPAPGTVRSITYFGIGVPSFAQPTAVVRSCSERTHPRALPHEAFTPPRTIVEGTAVLSPRAGFRGAAERAVARALPRHRPRLRPTRRAHGPFGPDRDAPGG